MSALHITGSFITACNTACLGMDLSFLHNKDGAIAAFLGSIPQVHRFHIAYRILHETQALHLDRFCFCSRYPLRSLAFDMVSHCIQVRGARVAHTTFTRLKWIHSI